MIWRATVAIVMSLMGLGACSSSDLSNPPPKDARVDGIDTPSCALSLKAVPPKASIGDTIEITASLLAGCGFEIHDRAWTVTDPNGQPVQPPSGSSTLSTIPLKVERLGTYTVSCDAMLSNSLVISETVSPTVRDPNAPTWRHVAQVLAPPGYGLPPASITFSVEGADVSGQEWTVDQNVYAASWSVKQGGQKIAAVARIFDPPADARDVYLPEAGAKVACVDKNVNVLVLPVSQTVLGDVRAVRPTSDQAVELAPGTAVDGKVMLATQAVAGAKVVLYTLDGVTQLRVPSTVGTTDASGAFKVYRRDGEAMLVVAPVASSLPSAVVDKLPATMGGSGWTLSYTNAGVPVDLSGKVLRADQVTPAVGARVELSLESTTILGELKAGGTSYPVSTWQYKRTLVSDAAGKLVDPSGAALKVPSGSYHAQVWPGSGEPAEQGYAIATGLDPSKIVLTLRKRVQLTGGMAKPDPRTKMLVTAVSPVATFSTTTSDGHFTLLVDDGMSYAFTARALGTGTRRLAAYVAPSVPVNGPRELGAFDLPSAVLYTGRLKQQNGNAVGGALIRVFCDDKACPDMPLVEETHADASGYFELRIPVPKVGQP